MARKKKTEEQEAQQDQPQAEETQAPESEGPKNKVTVEDSGPCKKKITIEIPEEKVHKVLDEKFSELRKEAQLAEVHPENRDRAAPHVAGHGQQRPVTAEHHHEIDAAAQLRTRVSRAVQPAGRLLVQLDAHAALDQPPPESRGRLCRLRRVRLETESDRSDRCDHPR